MKRSSSEESFITSVSFVFKWQIRGDMLDFLFAVVKECPLPKYQWIDLIEIYFTDSKYGWGGTEWLHSETQAEEGSA